MSVRWTLRYQPFWRFRRGHPVQGSRADLSIELRDGNGRQTEVHDFVKVLIQFFLEASDTVGLSNSGGGRKYADASDVYKIPEPVQECLQVI